MYETANNRHDLMNVRLKNQPVPHVAVRFPTLAQLDLWCQDLKAMFYIRSIKHIEQRTATVLSNAKGPDVTVAKRVSSNCDSCIRRTNFILCAGLRRAMHHNCSVYLSALAPLQPMAQTD